jgi:putative ABC transport system substrate-binding protein
MLDKGRRDFITLLGSASVAWPLASRAQQQAKIPRIGIIDDSPRWNAFRHELRDLGYLEGQNVAFDYAYGEGVPERLAEAVAQLVRRPVDIIATYGSRKLRGQASNDVNPNRHDFDWRPGDGRARGFSLESK